MGRQIKKKGKKKNKGLASERNTSKSTENTCINEKDSEVIREENQDLAVNKHKDDKYTVEQILDKAEEYIDSFDFEVAQQFCERALQMDRDNIRALETSGSLLLELGNLEAAKHCFGRAVEVKPDNGHAKYMYLGQLFTGADAVRYFQKGIEIMTTDMEVQQQNQISAACTEDTDALTVHDISSAYCSIAEIYMTDLCSEENAEEECRNNLEKAIEVDSESPEAYQLMSSFLLSKDNKEDAKTMIEKSVSLWLPTVQAVVMDDGSGTVDPVQTTSLTFSHRLTAAQISIEVDLFDTATTILEHLLDEDDTVVQIWYLLGWLNNLQGEDYKGNARYYLNKAMEVHKKTPCDDLPMVAHIQELLAELGPGDVEEENQGEDEELEIESDNDEPMEQQTYQS